MTLIKQFKADLPVKGVTLDAKMGADIDKIISENPNVSPFMKMFWEEQNKLQCSSPHGVKYHPMLIHFCLSLYAKSANAYEELRSSNILTLPSQRTLRDYRNVIKPQAGFNPEVIQQLYDTTNGLAGYQRYVVISRDEMKIKDNLVYDKSLEELIGFVDLGDPILKMESTAQLWLMMDSFFDCPNVRSFTEHKTSRKPNVAPYKNCDDPRLNWLIDNFLVYLRNWKLYTETLPGNLSQSDREKMFISRQTFVITVYSMVEVTRHLSSKGVPEVLSNRFIQHILEEHFGQHRSLGRRNENPSSFAFGYQEDTVRDRQTVMKITLNTSGRHEKNKRPWSHVNKETLKKRKTKDHGPM